MSIEEQEELLSEWKERLGLHDWRVSLSPACSPEEMTIDDAVGDSVWEESTKTARIEILDPSYYCECVEEFDWERTLVHELLHLKLCLLTEQDGSLLDRIVHMTIDDLARAFVDAKRSGREP